jgi:hypothetical protein
VGINTSQIRARFNGTPSLWRISLVLIEFEVEGRNVEKNSEGAPYITIKATALPAFAFAAR